MERVYDDKYEEEFLTSGRATEEDTYKTLFIKLDDYGVSLSDWNQDNIEEFVTSLGSVSVNSVNKYMQFLREYYTYICEVENIKPKEFKLSKDSRNYIDYNALLKMTINETDYKMLRDVLLVEAGFNTYNYRDSCIFVLAWNSLTNEEIRFISKNDVEFFTEYNVSKCKIWLPKRILVIDDEDDVKIIKETINEDKYYMIDGANKKDHFIDLKSSKALIRGVCTRESNSPFVSNPGEILSRVLAKIGVLSGSNIDIELLSLESIGRSRKIDLFRKGASIDEVKNLFTKETSADLYWLQSLSIVMKRQEKNNIN